MGATGKQIRHPRRLSILAGSIWVPPDVSQRLVVEVRRVITLLHSGDSSGGSPGGSSGLNDEHSWLANFRYEASISVRPGKHAKRSEIMYFDGSL
jgi:hypothetical protein